MAHDSKRMFAPAPRPKTVTRSIRIPEVMDNMIEQLAKTEDESANAYIVLVLDLYLQKEVEAGRVKLSKKSAS